MARLEVIHVPAAGGVPGRRWRSARLRKHSDFQKVYRNGRRIFCTHMTFFFLRRDAGPVAQESKDPEPVRVGFTVPRILGTAVERNRIRRRLREAVRLGLGAAGNAVDIVIHPKKSVQKADFAVLREEIAQAFQRIRSSPAGQRSTGDGV